MSYGTGRRLLWMKRSKQSSLSCTTHSSQHDLEVVEKGNRSRKRYFPIEIIGRGLGRQRGTKYEKDCIIVRISTRMSQCTWRSVLKVRQEAVPLAKPFLRNGKGLFRRILYAHVFPAFSTFTVESRNICDYFHVDRSFILGSVEGSASTQDQAHQQLHTRHLYAQVQTLPSQRASICP